MNTEAINIDGYTVTIAQDDSPENPFKAWDSEPPLLAFHDRSLDHYGPIEDLRDIIRLMPESLFQRGQRMALIKEYLSEHYTLRDIAQDIIETGSFSETFASLMSEHYSNTPSGWREAGEWMDAAESLLKRSGIPCHQEQSNGYCQGHSALVLAIATPDWQEKVGCEGEHAQKAVEYACKLYGWWAWGDVYGVQSITAPDGEEIDDASCWGFYGDNHKESGLMDHAREAIRTHKEQAMRAELHAANVRMFGLTSLTPA